MKNGGRKKITTFVDLQKVNEPLSLDMLKSPGRKTLLFVDDVFDALSTRAGSVSAQRRLFIADLVQDVLTRGRVHGMSVWTVLHKPKGGKIKFTETLYNECSLVVVFARRAGRNKSKPPAGGPVPGFLYLSWRHKYLQ